MTIFWQPSSYEQEHSQLALFMKKVESSQSQSFPDSEAFHSWSVKDSSTFWKLWLHESGLLFEGSAERVFETSKPSDPLAGLWFPDLKLNYAENLINGMPEVALVGLDESGRKKIYARSQVLSAVRSLQLELKRVGVGAGDRVAAVLPNCPEAIIAMLATTSLGAVWSSCSPDFGVQGILDRFGQIAPKFLFVADAYQYNGKRFELDAKNREVIAQLPTLKGHSCLNFMGSGGDFDALCAGSDGLEIEFKRLAFKAPLFVMFSSGTTGVPKCIVHGIGGSLLQHSKEHRLHCDLKAGEKILYFSTCGWMMWNWLVSASFSGATVYAYDGSPLLSATDHIWRHVDQEGIEVFGSSAKFIASCRSMGLKPAQSQTFKKLRLLLSTGSPLLPEDFDYFYESVAGKQRIQLASISGGTDIISCFMLGVPLKPVIRGEIQGRGLGMDVQAFNDQGQAVVAERGELVCRNVFPSMPISFFGDDAEQTKYRSAYFSRYPGVWHHGDYITLTPKGGIIVHGRSDATLNPGGVRIGTAEIYRQVETLPEVADSLVVGQQWEGDERVILFVRLKDPKATLDDELQKQIKSRIRAGASPRHVPAVIRQVSEIPYTISGKKVELAVKKLLAGEEPKNIEALSNPASLSEYRNLKL